MITIGVDAHKRVHVALAIDEAGQELGQWRGLNNAAGWQAISQWAAPLGSPRQWGIEGAWGYGRNLAQHLVAAGAPGCRASDDHAQGRPAGSEDR